MRRVHCYTQDDLFNLVELAYDLKDFVHHLFLVPELGVVLAHRAILQEMRAVLSITGTKPQLLSYDTTYNLGDFYVSPILFRHTLFEEAPVIPACCFSAAREADPVNLFSTLIGCTVFCL